MLNSYCNNFRLCDTLIADIVYTFWIGITMKYALLIVTLYIGIQPLALQASWVNNWNAYLQGPKNYVTSLMNNESIKKIIPIAFITAIATALAWRYYSQIRKQNVTEDDGVNVEELSSLPSLESSSQGYVDTSTIFKQNITMQNDVDTSTIFKQNITMQNGVQVTLTQYPVLNQFARDKSNDVIGGGAASCGYHTVLRAMQLVAALASKADERQILIDLNDTNSIAAYFAPKRQVTENKETKEEMGEWRKMVIDSRKTIEFRRILTNQLDIAIAQKDDDKATKIYKSALGNVANYLVAVQSDPNKRQNKYTLEDEDIRDYIQEGLEKINAKNVEELTKLRAGGVSESNILEIEQSIELIKKLTDQDIIQRYISFETIKLVLANDNTWLAMNVLWDQAINHSDRKIDFDGEWLDETEVGVLLPRHEKEDVTNTIIPLTTVYEFRAVADFSLINLRVEEPVAGNQKETTVNYLYDTLPTVWQMLEDNDNIKKEWFYIVAIGTMSQEKGSRGHWYPFIVHQNDSGHRAYYVMDSGGTNRTLNDYSGRNVRKLIDLIENKPQL